MLVLFSHCLQDTEIKYQVEKALIGLWFKKKPSKLANLSATMHS